jgi:thiamine biosynthesis protein ThiS
VKNLRVLVVDDTSLYRVMLTAILSEVQDVEVVGSAANGRMALAKVAQLKPDLITLDVEMPEMVAVQLNGEFVNKKDLEKTILHENDEIDFLYFMGGGVSSL